MSNLILTPEQQKQAIIDRVKRAQDKIAAILKEEDCSFDVQMVPKVSIYPNPPKKDEAK